MMRNAAIGIVLSSLLAACGGGGFGLDGGQSGTGIASIVGNVVAPTGTALSDISVRVDGTSLATNTDAGGNFALAGELSGDVELVFERGSDMLFASLGVAVPKGGVVSLADVFLDAQTGKANPALREVEFEGLVDTIDCAAGTLLVTSGADPEGIRFAVDLASASIRDEQERPISCQDLQVGDRVEVESEVEDDGVLVRTAITRKGGEGEDDKATPGEDDQPGGDGGADDQPGEDGGEDDQPGEDGGEDDQPGGDGGADDQPGGDGGEDDQPDEDGGADEELY
jgi:hypothetical protein